MWINTFKLNLKVKEKKLNITTDILSILCRIATKKENILLTKALLLCVSMCVCVCLMNIYRLVCAHACVCVSNGYRQTFKSQGVYVSVCLMNIYRLACAHVRV